MRVGGVGIEQDAGIVLVWGVRIPQGAGIVRVGGVGIEQGAGERAGGRRLPAFFWFDPM